MNYKNYKNKLRSNKKIKGGTEIPDDIAMVYVLNTIAYCLMLYYVGLYICLTFYYNKTDNTVKKKWLDNFINEHLYTNVNDKYIFIIRGSSRLTNYKTIEQLKEEEYDLFCSKISEECRKLYTSNYGSKQFNKHMNVSDIKMALDGNFTIHNEALKLQKTQIAFCQQAETSHKLITLYAKYCLAVFYHVLALEINQFKVTYGITDEKLYQSQYPDNNIKNFVEFFKSIAAKLRETKKEHKDSYFSNEVITASNIEKIHQVYLSSTHYMTINLISINCKSFDFKLALETLITYVHNNTDSPSNIDLVFHQAYAIRMTDAQNQIASSLTKDNFGSEIIYTKRSVDKLRAAIKQSSIIDNMYIQEIENKIEQLEAKAKAKAKAQQEQAQEQAQPQEQAQEQEQEQEQQTKRYNIGTGSKARAPSFSFKRVTNKSQEKNITVEEEDETEEKENIKKLRGRLKYLKIKEESCYKHKEESKCYDIYKLIDNLYSMASRENPALFISDISDGSQTYDFEELKELFKTIYNHYGYYIFENNYEILFVLLTLNDETLKKLYDKTTGDKQDYVQTVPNVIKRLYKAHNFIYRGNKLTGGEWIQDIRGIERIVHST
jgi:hypothetical protein